MRRLTIPLLWLAWVNPAHASPLTLCVSSEDGDDTNWQREARTAAREAGISIEQVIGVASESDCADRTSSSGNYLMCDVRCEGDTCTWSAAVDVDDTVAGTRGTEPRTRVGHAIARWASETLGLAEPAAPEPVPAPAATPAPAPAAPAAAPPASAPVASAAASPADGVGPRPAGALGIGIGVRTPVDTFALNTASARIRAGNRTVIEPTASFLLQEAAIEEGAPETTTSYGYTYTYTSGADATVSVKTLSAGLGLRQAVVQRGPVDLSLLVDGSVAQTSSTATYTYEGTTSKEKLKSTAIGASWGLGLEWFPSANWSISADGTNPLVDWTKTADPDSANGSSTETSIGLGWDPAVRIMAHLYL